MATSGRIRQSQLVYTPRIIAETQVTKAQSVQQMFTVLRTAQQQTQASPDSEYIVSTCRQQKAMCLETVLKTARGQDGRRVPMKLIPALQRGIKTSNTGFYRVFTRFHHPTSARRDLALK